MILQLKSKNGELKIENEELKNTLAERGDAVENSAEEPEVWEFFCLCKIHHL
jgi:regulator of replication initiation timing